jgi:DNA-binding transcriptional ArsR family regulator
VIEWRFSPDDVARIRFAFSPLWELMLSLIVLRAPARHSLHLPWVRETRPRITGLDLSELFALVPVRGDTADFLTPAPTSPLPEFAAEIEQIRSTSPEHVVAEIDEVRGVPAPIARRIADDPAEAVRRITDTLRAYWDVALAEHWPRVRTLLEADVLWRSRRLAVGGARALFEDLHESVAWHGDRLSAADPHDHAGSLAGEGLLLVPSAMCWPTVRKMIEPYQPMVAYPVRGITTLWEARRQPPPGALAALVGNTRAAVLAALAEPTCTTALARRLSVTPGAVSQHLSVLAGCGLVASTRVGREVLYRRTRAGDELTGER